jgi:hypothetical protein
MRFKESNFVQIEWSSYRWKHFKKIYKVVVDLFLKSYESFKSQNTIYWEKVLIIKMSIWKGKCWLTWRLEAIDESYKME